MKIYHNPKCRKSRETLAIVEDKTSAFEIVDYIKNPITFEEIKLIITEG